MNDDIDKLKLENIQLRMKIIEQQMTLLNVEYNTLLQQYKEMRPDEVSHDETKNLDQLDTVDILHTSTDGALR